MPDWQRAEKFLQDLLGLEPTVASGSKFYDQGDAVNRAHYADDDFTVMADSKSTNHKSYSVTRKFMEEWFEKAALLGGRRFLLHIEFQDPDGVKPDMDLVLCSAADFSELYEAARRPPEVVKRSITPQERHSLKRLRLLVQNVNEPDVRLDLLNDISILEGAFNDS